MASVAQIATEITQLLVRLQEILTFPLVLHAIILVTVATFVSAILQHEVDLPVLVSFPVAFFVALIGYGVSVLSNFIVDIPMLWSLAGQMGILVLAVLLYEAMS